ncbi:lysozyme family protein [Sphingobium ummariense]|nr:hypothetical protein [Sphingobium ummariense]
MHAPIPTNHNSFSNRALAERIGDIQAQTADAIRRARRAQDLKARLVLKIPYHEWAAAVERGRTSELVEAYTPKGMHAVHDYVDAPRCPPWATRKYRGAIPDSADERAAHVIANRDRVTGAWGSLRASFERAQASRWSEAADRVRWDRPGALALPGRLEAAVARPSRLEAASRPAPGSLAANIARPARRGFAATVELARIWQRLDAESFPRPIGEMLFDLGVNGDPVTAKKLLQRALNGCLAKFLIALPPLKVDGILGEKTRAALDVVLANAASGMPVLKIAYQEAAKAQYRSTGAATLAQPAPGGLAATVDRLKGLGGWSGGDA